MDKAWKIFEGTGKVTDYLNYCRNRADSVQRENKEQERLEASAGKEERKAGWDKVLY